jgi:hypothetical protein
MDATTQDQSLDKRRKEMRPERIDVADEVFERNDVCAARYGSSERTINRGDRDGAPFRFFNGVKYRPVRAYDAFILSTVKILNPRRRRSAKSTEAA